jgi:predicted O-methyltransferase YrrM
MNDFSLTEADLRVALALCNEHQPKRVLEFGVNEGNTAAFLLKHCPFIEEYVGVDLVPELFPNRGIVPKKAGWRVGDDPRYRSVLTDETVGDFHNKMAGQGEFDLLVMDANHEDWATKRDTEACWRYLRPGGLCLWHDYGVESRQHSNGKPFSLIHYIDALIASGRQIMTPDDLPRDPWRCVSIAYEVKQ